MTVAGARGQTRSEMLTALSLPDSPALHAHLWALQRAWDHPDDVELTVANRVWVEQSLPLDPVFSALISWDYGAGIETADFKQAPEPGRVRINAWLAAQTHDRIPELLNPGIIDGSTRMVLTNAVCFLGDWAMPFTAGATYERAFTRADGSTVQTPLMRQCGTFDYAEIDGVQVLKMPYEGDRFSMVALLPAEGRPLDALQAALGSEVFSRWLPQTRLSLVDVSFPRFRFEGGAEFSARLDDLGIPLAFSDDADFSRMTSGDSLKIGAVIHKTFIEVDEAGTEAAAATAAVMVPRGWSIHRPQANLFPRRPPLRVLHLGHPDPHAAVRGARDGSDHG